MTWVRKLGKRVPRIQARRAPHDCMSGAPSACGDVDAKASVVPEAIALPELPRRIPRSLDSRVARPERAPIDPVVMRKILDALNHIQP